MKESVLTAFLAGGAAGVLVTYLAIRASGKCVPTVTRSLATDATLERQHSSNQLSTSGNMDNMHEDEILTEQFTRNVQFFGKQGQLKVAKAFVVVIGLGVSSFLKICNRGQTAMSTTHAGSWKPCCTYAPAVWCRKAEAS